MRCYIFNRRPSATTPGLVTANPLLLLLILVSLHKVDPHRVPLRRFPSAPLDLPNPIQAQQAKPAQPPRPQISDPKNGPHDRKPLSFATSPAYKKTTRFRPRFLVPRAPIHPGSLAPLRNPNPVIYGPVPKHNTQVLRCAKFPALNDKNSSVLLSKTVLDL